MDWNNMGLAIFLLCVLTTGWAPHLQDAGADLERIIRSGSPQEVARALAERGPDFQVDAELLQSACDRPEVLQAILDHIYGRTPVREPKASVSAPAKPVTADPIPPRDFSKLKMYSLIGNILTNDSLAETPEKIAEQIEIRKFVSVMLLDPEFRITLDEVQAKVEGNIPEWLQFMIDSAEQGKEKGFPRLRFSADRNVRFSIPDREDGVRGYLGLFLVKSLPNSDTVYSQEEQILFSHEKLPMTYDQENSGFEMSRIKSYSRSVLSLRSTMNRIDELELFPGYWGIRFQYTNGFGKVRSDQSFYFEVKAGKNYRMHVQWDEEETEFKRLSFDLVEEDIP